ncbi:GNAT family acetyltransferase [Exophiala viscosa]|uniref:GNAT family acetyltransferase n=1 Tax=Exophiala viscosa TaxID=2486360 RepID=UPI00218DCAC6|nr:GNAT family acetyltransferase [Exophiala viscosa]
MQTPASKAIRVSYIATFTLNEHLANDHPAEWHQNIGAPVSTTPAPRPEPVTLTGKTVTLKPLTPEHAVDLYAAVEGDDKRHVYTYLSDEPYTSLEAFREAVTTKSESKDPVFFAIVDNKTHSPMGWAALMRIDTKNRVIEVGNILYSPSLQRTVAATEAMYLMAKHVFNDLGYRRYEWKCDNFNLPSKRAALRLGFTFEGIFRQHMIYKGRSRDTAWFSVIDSDWPVVKNAFEMWLDDGNFDLDGRQRQRLEDLRGELPG